jgi:Mitochondrial carrier protein
MKFFSVVLSCATICTYAAESRSTIQLPKFLPHIPDYIINPLIGGISAAASMFVYTPIGSYCQNRHIQGLPIEWKKPQHWWRGYRTIAANNMSVIALQNALYQSLANKMNSARRKYNNWNTIFAASIAGGASGPVNNVSQLIVLYQQNTGLSVINTINSFPDTYKSLHRATLPATYRGMLFANTYINCLPFIKNRVHECCTNDAVAVVTSALFASLFATATTQPAQVIITKLHADIKKEHYKGPCDAFKKIIVTGGIRALYAGWFYRTLGNILAIPTLYFVQQKLYALKNSC